jgi:hypothetical protein
MRPVKRLVCAAAATILAAAASPASAESPLTPGFWSFTYEPGASASVLDDYCSNGFFLVLDANHRMSFYVDGDRLINDGSDTCTFDAASNTETCQTSLWNGSEFKPSTSSTVYSMSEGALKAVTQVAGEPPVETFPLQCRAEIVRDVLAKALPPVP